MSSYETTKKNAAKVTFNDSDSLLRLAETLKLRSLAASTPEGIVLRGHVMNREKQLLRIG